MGIQHPRILSGSLSCSCLLWEQLATATYHIDHRGSPAGLLGVCSYLGRPETEAVGRPAGQPLGWQVEEGPLEGRTDQGVGVEDRSQNLQG